MSYFKTYEKYIAKNQFHNGKSNILPSKLLYDVFIVIPVYDELDYLLYTLESIESQSSDINFLVIIVINNSCDDLDSIKSNNRKLYQLLKNIKYKYEFILLDCFSKKHALKKQHSGVGWARKIGMDFCIQYSHSNSLLCCIDADTLIHRHYISIILQQYQKTLFCAGVVNFSHQKSDNKQINKNIKSYEKILKDNAEKLQKINSPYGYVSMGSTIVCTVKAYIEVGGMSKKKATEDFYFLQKLAKYKGIYNIKDILVFPSPRAEQRVYLGTGFRMKSMLQGDSIINLKISQKALNSIELFYQSINVSWNISIKLLLLKIKEKDYFLWKFLVDHNCECSLLSIKENVKTKEQFVSQCHKWFDNFKIYRYANQVR